MTARMKVYAYITHGNKLLVFEERGFPEGGIQVPGGAPNVDEPPDAAAIRESIEETGLQSLKLVRFLGEDIFDVSIYGINEVHRRLFYHLIYEGDPLRNWENEERDPSARTLQTPERIIFDFYWWDLKNGIPELQLGFDAKLSALLGDLGLVR